MADQEQVLIEVKFDTSAVSNAQKALQQNLSQLRENKKELSALEKEIKAGNDLTEAGAKRYAELNAKIEENKRSIKSNTAIIQAATMAKKDENSTLDEQRQYLNTLQKAFAGLTQEQKDAMGGQEALEAAIKSVSDSLKEQEHAIGDDRRNVGNYAESITKAFGDMAHAGELISPAVGILRGMGSEGKKAAAMLDSLGKVLQLAGKAGNVFATATKAQTVATNGQTVAQEGLNAAMAANPIGLIIAGISTLLPLIQAFCSNEAEAERAQKAFNNELERQSRLIDQMQKDAEFEAKVAGIFGASAQEQLRIQKQAAQQAYDIADAEEQRLLKAYQAAKGKEREVAKEAWEKAQEQTKAAWTRLNNLNQEEILLDLKTKKEAEEEKTKIQKEAADKRKKIAEDEAAQIAADERALGIQLMEANLMLLHMEAEALEREREEIIANGQALLESLNEEEDEEDIPTVDEMCRDMFGLDQEGVDYFRSLLDQGVSFAQAKTQAIADQQVRMTKAWATSFGALGKSFSDMGNMLGDFADESEGAAKAQKGFAFTAIMLNQAQSIANGALAISEGIASAASIPFPANIPAIISIVAEIAALMAGVGTSIVQAKQIFAQSDAGKFAEGGIVGGTSYTGDKLTANVNSREMILPLDDQKTLFDALSSGTEGNRSLGIDYDLMAAAVAAQPAPVVVYSELQEFGQKVSTYNEIARV